MKLRLMLAMVLMAACTDSVFASVSTEAATALARRILGEQCDRIRFQDVSRNKADAEFFTVEDSGGGILVSGTGAPAMAMGLNWYLRYRCKVDVSWYSHDPVRLPSSLPVVGEPFTSEARVANRFFLNYCTFGYTLPWWGWKEWERFIDWMALNGINLPLAITGQESVWYKVWSELGLTDDEIRGYFTGPAHLPWHRMQNIDRWQGPLPVSWLDGQEELQRKIVRRERELGMRTVLPAFAGHVPQAIKRIFPDADIRSLGEWAGFKEPYTCWFLDPMDPLYSRIQKRFLEIQEEMYGTDHIYGIDLFNEVTPPSWEPDYLARVGRQVCESLVSADKDAVWLQMTWLFYYQRKDWRGERIKSYITSYPAERSMLLDYYCDYQEVWKMTDSFYGVPFIWCYLGNFGGNSMLKGNFADTHEKIENVLTEAGPGICGLGGTLEGFDCNPYMFDYVFEKAWSYGRGLTPEKYASALAERRADGSAAAAEAWNMLARKIYNGMGHRSPMTLRPDLGRCRHTSEERCGFPNADLKKALELLFDSSAKRFDLVNMTRQYLANVFQDEVLEYSKAFDDEDPVRMKALRGRINGIFKDMDALLACEPSFLLGGWISDARSRGADKREKNYFESNARCLITTWGDRGSSLGDYASREWSGLMSSFYLARWNMFFDYCEDSVRKGKDFDQEGFSEKVSGFEKDWWTHRKGHFRKTADPNYRKRVADILRKY